jgi:nuclear factor related to kappa-B-binding protein
MVSLFVEMQKQWENSPDADIDERLEIWHRFQTQPLPLPKPKRVVRKPGTVRRIKVGVDVGPKKRVPERVLERVPERVPERIPERVPERVQERIPERVPERVPEANPKLKIIEPPKKGKLVMKGSRSEVGALAPPAKKKYAMLEPTPRSKGVLKIKTILKERAEGRSEGPSKRLVDLEITEPLRVNKPGPKGVLKLVSKSKGVLKKTASLAVKGKAPVTESKKEELYELTEDEYEEEPFMPVEIEALSPLPVQPKVISGEGSGEKKPKRNPPSEGKKRKTIELGGGVPEGEVVLKKKKKKKIKEIRDEIVPLEVLETFMNESPVHEDIKAPVDKGKKLGESKKKPHRKKKIDEIPEEPESFVVTENRAIEDDFRASDDFDDKPLEAAVEEDQVDSIKEEVEAKPRKRTKKKPKAEKAPITSPGESSPPAGQRTFSAIMC